MVKDRAGTAADGLTAYAESMGWTVSFSESYKNGTATVKQTFSNSKYKFDTTVSAQRKSGKIAITYTRKGVKSSAKAIKGWLKTYKV